MASIATSMVDYSLEYRSVKDDLKRFFDSWNLLGLFGVVVIGAISWWVGKFSTQSVLAAVTGLYAFIAFNQMREARRNRRPASNLAVRPHFYEKDDADSYDFGLKNFGDSPALNFRLIAILREGDSSVDTLTVSARDRHLHLEEESFISVITEASENQSFGNLADAQDPIYENLSQKSIELYYTFESNNGICYPRDWNNPMEMELEQVVEKADSPRTVEMAEIYDKCT